MIKLSPPIKNFSFAEDVSQIFGVNRFLYWPNFRLPGHNGIDIRGEEPNNGYGTLIYASHDGWISKLVKDEPAHTKGNGIYLNSRNSSSFSTVYWHLSKFNNLYEGQEIKQGDLLGEMGNSGFVKPEPTSQRPYDGVHLHFGIRFPPPRSKEYASFVDPSPFFYQEEDKFPLFFSHNFGLGANGDLVSLLQTILKIEGFAEDYEPLAYFGYKTFRDVRKLQQKHGILSTGYVGPKTRNYLNNRYSAYS